MSKDLKILFPNEGETLLAQRLLNYFRRQQRNPSQGPIGLDPSLVAYFQEDWQELVDDGSVKLSLISDSGIRVRCGDVERKLPYFLDKLVEGEHLMKRDGKYTVI